MRDKMNDPARIDLMREAVSNIEEFLQDIDTCSAFIANKILCHAVIYNLQCIGENAYKLTREFVSSHSEIDWETIEGLRHVLVHDYYTVNMEMVWNILEKDLPQLKNWLDNHQSLTASAPSQTRRG